MARIRSIKPEFWTSPQIVVCSLPARLAFIGLLNFSDDNGIHPASASRLRMQVFPEDGFNDDAVRDLIAELIRAGLVAPYIFGDEDFWCVTGWDRHQKIDRPTFRHPLPDGTRGQRMPGEVRRRISEESANSLVEPIRRADSSNLLVEPTRRGSSGTEWNGVEWSNPPSHVGEVTTGDGGVRAEKIPRRRFVAVGGDHA